MSETKVFIHVGLHKTGTTFLQNEVFPKIPEINYQRKVDLTTSVVEGKTNLFSDENLDGGSYRLFSKPDDRYKIAMNLYKMFPNAGIIVCLRDEKSWLRSAWKQYVLSYYGYTFKDYCKKMDKETLNFKGYVFYLSNLFNDNVFVTNYETLVKDPQNFVKGICDFIGVETPVFENKETYKSLSYNQTNAIILFDKIFKSKTVHLILSLVIRFIRNDPTIQKFREKHL
jgi:hypothetical protein